MASDSSSDQDDLDLSEEAHLEITQLTDESFEGLPQYTQFHLKLVDVSATFFLSFEFALKHSQILHQHFSIESADADVPENGDTTPRRANSPANSNHSAHIEASEHEAQPPERSFITVSTDAQLTKQLLRPASPAVSEASANLGPSAAVQKPQAPRPLLLAHLRQLLASQSQAPDALNIRHAAECLINAESGLTEQDAGFIIESVAPFRAEPIRVARACLRILQGQSFDLVA